MKKQAEAFGARIIHSKIDSIDKIKNTFCVHTESGEYSSFALLIATGAEHRSLGVPGEKELTGRGVSYCATCDGPFFRNKAIVVVGGGDSACTEALYLATLSPHVTLVHRKSEFRAQYAVVEKVKNEKNIRIKYNTLVKEIRGNGRVQSVLLEDTNTGIASELPVDAVFIFVGMKARTELFEMLPKDKSGYIVTNEKMETIMPGLYCAGDVRAKPFRQIVTAVSDGAIAAYEAAEYVKSLSPRGERA